MLNKRAVIVLALAMLFLISGCASQAGLGGAADMDEAAPAPSAPEAPPAADGDYGERQESTAENVQRIEIKTAEININVENLRDSEKMLTAFVADRGGFIESSNFYTDAGGEATRSQLTVRVPQEHFDETMTFLSDELGRVTHSNTNKGDVTMQYIDMEARINNLTSQETRYTEILDQAETVEDILQIERELVRIRGEIESLTAQFNYLRERVNFSTINVTLRQTVLATPGVTASGFKGAGQRALIALTESINMLINGAAGLFVFAFRALPFVIFFLLAVYIIYRILKRIDKRHSA